MLILDFLFLYFSQIAFVYLSLSSFFSITVWCLSLHSTWYCNALLSWLQILVCTCLPPHLFVLYDILISMFLFSFVFMCTTCKPHICQYARKNEEKRKIIYFRLPLHSLCFSLFALQNFPNSRKQKRLFY